MMVNRLGCLKLLKLLLGIIGVGRLLGVVAVLPSASPAPTTRVTTLRLTLWLLNDGHDNMLLGFFFVDGLLVCDQFLFPVMCVQGCVFVVMSEENKAVGESATRESFRNCCRRRSIAIRRLA